MTERWKDIPGYEGRYQVSSLYRVRSLRRTVTCNRNGIRRPYTRSGRLLTLHIDRANGRPYANLYDERHQRHIYNVATLFMMAFGRELIK